MQRAAPAILLAAALLSGCGTAAGQRDARRAAERFEAALEARDGAAACAQLTPDAGSALASSEKAPCAKAVLAVGLTPSPRVVGASVWVTSAQVRLARDTLFLDDTPQGWKISAAGCRPQSDKPYDCELED